MTLVATACSSPLVEDIVAQVRYLVEDKGADATIPDVNGNTAVSTACTLWELKMICKDLFSYITRCGRVIGQWQPPSRQARVRHHAIT